MKIVYASLPLELFKDDLHCLWEHFNCKLHEQYPDCKITSNYTGDGSVEDSDIIIFVYEYRDYKSCREEFEKCRKLDKPYNFFTKIYRCD